VMLFDEMRRQCGSKRKQLGRVTGKRCDQLTVSPTKIVLE
jgi:hypothetical protein